MNTADLHPKPIELTLTVAHLRQLADSLLGMEHAPHDRTERAFSDVPADKIVELDRAGQQLAAYVACLIADTREKSPETPVRDSLPLLRFGAKYLYTACDRCRREALQAAREHQTAGNQAGASAALDAVHIWDQILRQLSTQHGVASPLRGLVAPLPLKLADLQALGLEPGSLMGGAELLAAP